MVSWKRSSMTIRPQKYRTRLTTLGMYFSNHSATELLLSLSVVSSFSNFFIVGRKAAAAVGDSRLFISVTEDVPSGSIRISHELTLLVLPSKLSLLLRLLSLLSLREGRPSIGLDGLTEDELSWDDDSRCAALFFDESSLNLTFFVFLLRFNPPKLSVLEFALALEAMRRLFGLKC